MANIIIYDRNIDPITIQLPNNHNIRQQINIEYGYPLEEMQLYKNSIILNKKITPIDNKYINNFDTFKRSGSILIKVNNYNNRNYNYYSIVVDTKGDIKHLKQLIKEMICENFVVNADISDFTKLSYLIFLRVIFEITKC